MPGQALQLVAGFDIEANYKLFDSKFDMHKINIPFPLKEEIDEELQDEL